MSDKEMTAPSGQEEVKEELTVEESFAALEKISARLESEDVTREESVHLYQEGMKLLKSVHDKLDGYEKKMQILTGDGSLEDFE